MFGKKKSSFGLDIGSHSIKCVELGKSGDVVTLENCVINSIYPENVRYDSEKEDFTQIASALAETFNKIGVSPKRVKNLVSSIGGSSVNVKQIRTVPLTEEELENSLKFEARKHMPVSGSQMILDFQVLNSQDNKKKKSQEEELDVLLVVSNQKAFMKHISLLKNIELNPGIVDVDILGAVNSYLFFNTVRQDEIYVFLNICAERTNLAVYDPDGLFFCRDLPYGGNHFSDDLMKKYEVDFEVAERIKKEKGLFHEEGEQGIGSVGISIAEKPAYESLLVEVNRSLRYYFKESGKNNYGNIVLTGGSAKIPDIDTYFSEQLNIPVEVYNPLQNVEISSKVKIETNFEPQIAQAVGLALRFGE